MHKTTRTGITYLTLARWAAIGWMVIILIGCLTPHDEIPDVLTGWDDKFQHLAIFAGFGFLWREADFEVVPVLIAGLIFGGLIEILQYVLPINRSGDWLDLAADFAGTIVGVVLALVWSRLYPDRRF
jgi:hypothetical protein